MSLKIALSVLLLVALSNAIRYHLYNADGEEVYRTLRVVRAPPAYPNTVEVRAVEKNARRFRKATEIDAIDYIFSTANIPHFTVRHFTKDSDGAEGRAARHGLRKLVEYVEAADPNSGFSPDNDTIVQSYYLWAQTWTPMVVTPTTVGSASVTSVCSHTTDNVVEICAYFADVATALSVNGSSFTLNSNAVHHTLRVTNFPFTRADSKLALKVHFHSRTRARELSNTETGAGEEGAELVGTEGDSIRPVAAWATTVDVTGCGGTTSVAVKKDVYRSVESSRDVDISKPTETVEISFGTTEQITYFSFMTPAGCQPTSIFWDPELGIQDDSSSAVAVFPSLLFLFALLKYLF